MEKWLDAYSQWPPVNQMTYSLAVLLSIAGLLTGAGWLAIRLLGMHHARPVRPVLPKNVSFTKQEIRNLLVQVLEREGVINPDAVSQSWIEEQKQLFLAEQTHQEVEKLPAEEKPPIEPRRRPISQA